MANFASRIWNPRTIPSGFQKADSPILPEQKTRIRKGEQARLTFNLQATPHLASLAIQGGLPGTTVLIIYQANVGTVQSDGTLNVAAVNPGDHTIELRRDRYKWKQFKKHFTAGAPVALSAADVALEAAPGELKITFTPADAIVTLSEGAERTIKVTSGNTTSLAAGSYNLNARTADNFIRSATVEIAAGRNEIFGSFSPPRRHVEVGRPNWLEAGEGRVRPQGRRFRHVAALLTPRARSLSRPSLIRATGCNGWLLNCADAHTRFLYQMDDDNLYRTVVRNGQKGDEIKIPHKSDKKAFRTLMIRVGTSEIVHQIKQGDGSVVLNCFSVPGTYLNQGRFGFDIPGGDQVALANFSHYSDLSAK